MRTLIRVGVLGFAALLTGLTVNQVRREGLQWRLLRLTLDPAGRREAWQPLSADSAFIFFAERAAVFVDIRDAEAYRTDHIPGAVSSPFFAFFRDPAPLLSGEKTRPHILYCQEAFCRRDRLMAQALKQAGFEKVFFLRNGYMGWLDYGFPITSDSQ